MSDFTTITSQEQLDSVIADRLKRNEEKWAKKYEGYLSPDDVTKKCGEYEKQIADLTTALDGANKKNASYDKEIAEKNSLIKGYELSSIKSRVAHESGLAYEAIEFLRGEDEESIKKSAESLKNLVGSKSVPKFESEPNISSAKNAEIRKLAQSLTNKN